MSRALATVAVAALIGAAGCTSDQAPEIAPAGSDATATTSRTLAPCPPGGPDDTTPPAGCLDEDGVVVRP